MFSPKTPRDPVLERLAEISSEFTDATKLVENVVDAAKGEIRLSFDNGYSIVIRADSSAAVEPF
jgi:hypothetical protein